MLATIFLHTLTSFISGTEKDSHMIVSLIESLEFSEFFHDQLYQLATIFHIANRAWKKSTKSEMCDFCLTVIRYVHMDGGGGGGQTTVIVLLQGKTVPVE